MSMNNALTRPTRKVMRSGIDRTKPNKEVISKLKELKLRVEHLPQRTFDKWLDFVQRDRNRELTTNVNAQKLRHAMHAIPKHNLRDAFNRIIAKPDKVRVALLAFARRIQRAPKEAFDNWKQYVNDVNNKKLLDAERANKLHNALTRIPRRTLKDAHDRIIGEGDKLKGALRTIMHTYKNAPKQAFDKWKKLPQDVSDKKLLSALHANKLRNALRSIITPTLKDATDRILGGGNKLTGALRRVAI